MFLEQVLKEREESITQRLVLLASSATRSGSDLHVFVRAGGLSGRELCDLPLSDWLARSASEANVRIKLSGRFPKSEQHRRRHFSFLTCLVMFTRGFYLARACLS